MIAMEKICGACGRKFIVREAESTHWKKICYCTLCNKEYAKKKEQEKERIDNEKYAAIRAANQAEFEERIANQSVIELSDIQVDDTNTLYIIGNGFDLMHGVKSSYYSFRNSLGKHSNLRFVLETFWTPEDIWADFEEGLAHFNVEMMAGRFMVENWLDDTGYFEEGEDSAANFYMAAEFAVNPMETVATELPERFRAWVESLSIRTDDRPLKALIKKGKVLSFNYTEFIEDLYGVPMSNVCYIHGCRRKIKYKPKEKLILGHKPGASDSAYDMEEKPRKKRTYHSEVVDQAQEVAFGLISEYDQELTKETSEIIERHHDFFDSLKNIKSIVTIGHSISEVDWDYFKKVTESVEEIDKVNWYFGCHGLTDLNHIDTLVSWLGLKNTNIFRTDKIHVNTYPELVIHRKQEYRTRELAISKNAKWKVVTARNILQIVDIESKAAAYEAIIHTPINRAFFTDDEYGLLLISYAYPDGIQLLRFADQSWKYCDELKPVQNQCIINRRLRKVFMTNETITFVYNSRIRKYSLLDGTVVSNQKVRQAFQRAYTSEGVDVTNRFVRANRI